jgi:DNA-binding IclR family transcriptional regulator
MLTVSRSVDRVFQIMELFSARRRPLSATEIRAALRMPHSSAVSVLSRLVTLGYLNQNPDSKRFFPSLRLHRLCGSVPEAIIGGNPLADLVDSIQCRVDETTSVSRLDGLFTMPIYVRSATHAEAVRVIPGLNGGLATQSVVGRALLSTLPDPELARFVERAGYWARRARVGVPHDPEQTLRAVEFAREHGFLCSYNQLLQGVGAVSCPLPTLQDGEQLAITIAGTSERIERRSRHIINTLLRDVQAFLATGAGHFGKDADAAANAAPQPAATFAPTRPAASTASAAPLAIHASAH